MRTISHIQLAQDHSTSRRNSAQGFESAMNDLDYQLFPINDTRYHVPNTINLSPTHEFENYAVLHPERVVSVLRDADVWANTATTGPVKGSISGCVSYVKLASSKIQEMWTVHLSRKPSKPKKYVTLLLLD
jgi:hypothetical protein